MPPRRRSSVPVGADDISTLTLPQINERIERNERVLNTSLFSPFQLAGSPPAHDPVRDRLLAIRQALQERKRELEDSALDRSLNGMSLDAEPQLAESSAQAQRRDSGGGLASSGRAMAMQTIQVQDAKLPPNSVTLPLSETLALGRRDFDDATARNLAGLSFTDKSKSPLTPRRRHRPPSPAASGTPTRDLAFDPTDEIARAQATARMQAFMSYKGDPEDEDEWDLDLDGEGEYDGEGDTFALRAQGREPHRYERGTREEVDEFGEDDEDWAEGNDDYLDRIR
ncbi:hypothetical protein BD324DRAFT_647974 [Kockovaella imperatae]|uniref:Uncharacterized protein n=1 Tax=Kockovaella imperatae TaxID=4999 RepID=A0A1Y1UTY0_9TREE|nr:hypothetical protein BD324DRAFT_647974 [Kockovaella imperatae]ORX41077.1 hypothetical protein BD324DRAFT_647974 [Kockovaella imperatae]